MQNYILNNGTEVPCIGYGTSNHFHVADFEHVIREAIEAGYRYLDTASIYETERALGKACRKIKMVTIVTTM